MNFKTIKFELQEDGIGILTLNRPDNLNAINFQMVEDLHKLYDHLMINLDCRVVILKAAGRVFCAGSDLKDGNILRSKRKPEEYKRFYYLDVPEVIKGKMYYQWRITQIVVKMRKITQPIIAIIHGPASGGGFAFTMACDIRIASEGARFNNAAIKLGLSGGDVATSYFLPRLIGMSRAAEILYTGRTIDAKEAEKIGYILKLVEEGKLLDAALELAKDLLRKSPLGLRMTKQVLNLTLDSPSLETMLQLENSSQIVCFSSKDLNEGATAFLEKREPKYPLR